MFPDPTGKEMPHVGALAPAVATAHQAETCDPTPAKCPALFAGTAIASDEMETKNLDEHTLSQHGD